MVEIEIQFNGETKTVQSDTVQGLLEEFGLASRKVAVELNKEIVSRGSYGRTKLHSGDSVEIVHFVGGG